MDTYITSAGDTADFIVWKYYGTTAGDIMQKFLDANPRLADQGAILPHGVEVKLPDVTAVESKNGVNLWD
jgi:phage tail protein X